MGNWIWYPANIDTKRLAGQSTISGTSNSSIITSTIFRLLRLDVDGDGYVDLVTSGWFTKKLAWWHNPGKGGTWPEHPIETGCPIEFSFLADLDNDGKANEILPQFGDSHPLTWYERDGHGGIQGHVVSDHSYGHGIGVGDVNGDHRNDILTSKGWLEAPADPRTGK